MDTLLVFGARNLGRVLARELSAKGWRVAAVARTESTIELLKDEVPEAIGLIGDASNAEDVERIFEEVGAVDLVVNAITTTPSPGGPIHEAPPEALDAYVGELLPGILNVLRVGGRLVFSHTTPWPYLAWNFEKARVGRRLRRSYFGIRRFDDGAGDGTVDFQLPYGEWIRCFRRNGLVVDDLVELRAPEQATTSYDDFDARWARRWPAEQIWVTRKAG